MFICVVVGMSSWQIPTESGVEAMSFQIFMRKSRPVTRSRASITL